MIIAESRIDKNFTIIIPRSEIDENTNCRMGNK